MAVFSLAYLLKLAQLSSFYQLFNFKIEKNTSSQSASKTRSNENPSPSPVVLSMIVGGDLMFDRHIRTKAETRGNYDFIFDPQLTDYLNSADYALANLEGPITLEQSVSQHSLPGGPGNYTFTFSPDITS